MSGSGSGPPGVREGPGFDVEAAAAVLKGLVRRTPLLPSAELSEAVGRPVHLKLESLQVTGSFKVRGAANRMASLSVDERRRGVVTCSSGNHGRAVAWVAERMGIPAVVCVPEWVDPVKLAGIREAAARVEVAGGTYDEAEEMAWRLCREEGLTFVHPFDDPHVVAGQGTIGREILADLPDTGRIVVPLSGGGLAGGIAWAVKERRPDVRVTAVSALRASVMLRSLEAGRPVELPEEPTLASALAGGIGLDNRWTYALVREWVDDHLTVDEEEIAAAMGFMARSLHLLVEGGGGVGIAAARAGKLADEPSPAETPVVIVVSGGNLDPASLANL